MSKDTHFPIIIITEENEIKLIEHNELPIGKSMQVLATNADKELLQQFQRVYDRGREYQKKRQ